MSQMLPYDEIEMWHGHPDLFMNKLEELLNIPVDSNIGYIVEGYTEHPNIIKEKQKISHLLVKIKYVVEMILVIIRKQ